MSHGGNVQGRDTIREGGHVTERVDARKPEGRFMGQWGVRALLFCRDLGLQGHYPNFCEAHVDIQMRSEPVASGVSKVEAGEP